MIQLEVFAYWETLPDGNHNRYGTILQSGGNTTIIGNAVLKNPGSASPISEENDSIFGREDGRLQFSPDATMYAIADLFMLDKHTGTIRLYNLVDFRDTVPEQALRASAISVDKVAEEILNGPPVPTYIGWGNLWQRKELIARAKDIFQAALPHSPYLNPDISKNEFIHPLYLMRYGANEPRCKNLITEFRSHIISLQQEQPEVDLVAELEHHFATTPKEQLEKEWKELEPWNNVGPTVQEFLYGKQPEVDLEKESMQYFYDKAAEYWAEHCELNKAQDQRILILNALTFTGLVRDFYELGLNARKK